MGELRVVFDLDDTLYAEREFAYSGFRAIESWANARWGITGIGDDMAGLLDDGHLGGLFKIAFEQHHPEHTAEDLAALHEIYRTHMPEIALFDDAVWALDHFARRGPIGLITDGTPAMQATKVKALEIEDHFHEIVFTQSGGGREFHKPHPWSFERMEAALGTSGDRFVYIGDNAAKDFVTPNARGWLSIQVRRESSIHDQTDVAEGGAPAHVITSLHELEDLLDNAARDHRLGRE